MVTIYITQPDGTIRRFRLTTSEAYSTLAINKNAKIVVDNKS